MRLPINRVKKTLGFVASLLFGRSSSRIPMKPILEAQVVSFDMFETLVSRYCSEPCVVFDIVQRKYNRIHPEAFVDGFRDARIAAEKTAGAVIYTGEPTVYEIYALLEEPYASAAHELLELELETELSICHANLDMKAVFDYAIDQGKRVVITSDMYLPSEWLAAILRKCGYQGYERIYVSSEQGASKRSGKMFQSICADLDIPLSGLFHVGDHPASDYMVPRHQGAASYLYRSIKNGLHSFDSHKAIKGIERDLLSEDVLESVLVSYPLYGRSVGYQMGFCVLGPILLGYSAWLHRICVEENPDSIWFLAREGHALKNAYEALFGIEDSASYVHVSRLALTRAMVGGSSSFDELEELLSSLMLGVETFGDLLELVGITLSDEDINNLEVHIDDRFEESDRSAMFDIVMRFGRCTFEAQHALLREYLEAECGFSGKTIICDIGWSGTMQVLLQKALPDMESIGVYLAASDLHDRESNMARASLDRRGYWCEASEWQEKGFAIRFALSALESLFLGREGTTLGYEKRNGIAVPVLDSGGDLLASGIIDDLEQGSEDFIAICGECDIVDMLDVIPPGSALLPYLNTVLHPNRMAMDFYSNLGFVTGMHRLSFVPKYGLLHYLFHPRDAVAELELSNSKVIWLRGLLKLPLPYFELLCFLTKWVGMKSSFEKSLGGSSAFRTENGDERADNSKSGNCNYPGKQDEYFKRESDISGPVRIAAGIVTYNPQKDRLQENIEAIMNQVEHIYVFDNASGNRKDMISWLKPYSERLSIIPSETNAGMAVGLNALARESSQDGFSHIFLLDQDSVPDENVVRILAQELSDEMGIVSANAIDRNTGVVESFGESCVENEHVITSGSLLNLRAWESVGGYDERLFLGWVDFEFCDNLISHNWRVATSGVAHILHECADQEKTFLKIPKRRKDGNGWELRTYTRMNRPFDRKKDEVYGRVLTIRKYQGTSICRMEKKKLLKSVAKDLLLEKWRLQTVRAYCEGFLAAVN